MVPVLLAAAAGAVIGALGRPHGRHLATPVLVLPSAVVAGVGLQFVIGAFRLPGEGYLFAVSLALLAGFAVVNRHIVGMGVLAIGLCANLVAVAVHGAMPVRPSALVAAEVVDAEDLAHTDLGAGRRFEETSDRLPILGDVIPVSPLRAAMSFGDLIALMGVGSIAGELARLARRGQRWSVADLVPSSTRRFPASGDGRFPPQPVVEESAPWEEVRIIDVRQDLEELDRGRDLVHAEERVPG